MNNLTEKTKQALIVGLMAAAMLLFFIIYYNMMFLSKQNTRNNIALGKAKSEVTALKKDLKEINLFLEKDEERQLLLERVEVARKRLPETEDAIEFFDIIRESARRTGIGFDSITPVSSRNQPNYREIPYDIQGDSRFHEFGQFLNLIECHPDRFLRVNSFTITNDDKRPSIHPINVQISTFMFQ